MILITSQEEHIDSGDLMRLLDTECSHEEDRLYRAHLANCSECKRRYDRIARLTNRFSGLLFHLEEPVSTTSQRSPLNQTAQVRCVSKPWWQRRAGRGAAIAALVLLAVAVASPVRAWVIETLRSALGFQTQTLPGEQNTGSLISFMPAGTEFQVELLYVQSAGVLRVFMDTTNAATATMIGQSAGEGFLVQSAGLTIRNSAASEVSYVLRLPRYCEVFEVRIAGDVVGRYQVGGLAHSRTSLEVDLTRRTGGGAGG